MVVFALAGFVFSSWAARFPDVQEIRGLTAGELGLLILATSVGAILGLPSSGWILARLGAVNTILLALAISMPGYILTAIAAPSGWPFALMLIGLFFFGLGTGVWDVAQNLEGTHIERALGKAIMPWFHAAFSAGTVLGALIGAALVAVECPIIPHLLTVATLTVIGVIVSVRYFLPAAPPAQHEHAAIASTGRQRSAWLEPRTLLIGVMVLAAAFAEGTANDWIAVAFVTGHNVEKSVGVVATAVFLTFMTAGRILGTRLLDNYGRVPVLRILFAAAVVGSVLVVFGTPPVAFIGAAIWGLGASLGFPVGMSAAADDPAHASARLSVVSTIGYVAFLGGPALLGFLGDHFGILQALLAVAVTSLLALIVVPVARPLPEETSETIPA